MKHTEYILEWLAGERTLEGLLLEVAVSVAVAVAIAIAVAVAVAVTVVLINNLLPSTLEP